MTRERQIKKQEEIRNSILEVAKHIITLKGVEGVSIRKITSELGYSPGIIYHYFKDKNEIIETLAMEGYMKILNSLKSLDHNIDNPLLEIKNVFNTYIHTVLENPEEYKVFMLSNDPNILKRTTVLEKGISKRSKTMKLLTETIQRGIEKGQFMNEDPELSAQILWSSTFGLIIRLITEKNISDEQKEKLIQHQLNFMLNGLKKIKEDV